MMTFRQGLFDCCIHGELTMEMALEWLDGDDLVIARRIIASGKFKSRACRNCLEPLPDYDGLCEGCNAVLASQERRAEGE